MSVSREGGRASFSDVVAGQESWERDGSVVSVDGYKWFGKPRNNQKSLRGEGGVGFLVRECLVDEVEFISQVRYEESVSVGGEGEKHCILVVFTCPQIAIVSL